MIYADEKYTIWDDEDTSWLDEEDFSEEGKSLAIQCNFEALMDCLDIQLSNSILVIGDLGLWKGRVLGYNEIRSGNIKDCFLHGNSNYICHWFIDKRGDLCCAKHHHDGVNYYVYREYKSDVSDSRIEGLKEKIYNKTVKRSDITRVTSKIGDRITQAWGLS